MCMNPENTLLSAKSHLYEISRVDKPQRQKADMWMPGPGWRENERKCLIIWGL